MGANDVVLIDQVIEAHQRERDTPLADDVAFELFACEQVLSERDLSNADIEAGLVGGGKDGGLDGVYVFLGDRLLSEDSEIFEEDFRLGSVPFGTTLSLWLVQAKREKSFTETAIDLVSSSTRRLLPIESNEEELRRLYSDEVVDRTGIFRQALRILASRRPRVEVRFYYVTRGDIAQINDRVEIKARDLESQCARDATPDAVGIVAFLGAAELWKRASTQPTYTLALPFTKYFAHNGSQVALVSLRDYVSFLRDENTGTLQRHIFDWNVRDYHGAVEVNKQILNSLLDPEAPEFWWLNNGVTIICSDVWVVGEHFQIEDVQIVNGLQSSHTIFNALDQALKDDPEHPAFDRLVLVRILKTPDPAHRDAVIRATNSQTTVTVASLRATDEIQRKIESYFLENGWYYDRRKNYYRNLGKPASQIIGIPQLAQSAMAMGLSKPDDARARPSSLLKKDTDYQLVFSESVPLPVYLWLAEAQHAVDDFLQAQGDSVSRSERTNLRFHLAMLATIDLLGSPSYSLRQLARIAEKKERFSSEKLEVLLLKLKSFFEDFQTTTDNGPDKVAKGPEFVEYILREEGFARTD